MDFSFIKNPFLNSWVILAPKRAKKPDQNEDKVIICPFENESENEVFRIGEAKVINNKYPFAQIHEIIIHSSDHDKNFDELSLEKAKDILRVYKMRFLEHMNKGNVYIFHNRGGKAGESLSHPHTQLAVIPKRVTLGIPPLAKEEEPVKSYKSFNIFCPNASQWPDEVWIYPKNGERMFGDITEGEIDDLSFVLHRLIEILELRHDNDFPFNFYIYPGNSWYLRIMPRLKTLGGFELGTGIFVNTQDPKETISFIMDNFDKPDPHKIKSEHMAEYSKGV